ncbi:hypothetical protein LEP1GSC202_0791 [Leptospira yanagawae serovar Saopaulo str. Sao Paulo = ATCC 700523]|uniref:Uncharacterized protein n=1 Tax=Leptospira yanagawae serovar Saopaulo str. Sao Paulo = ATCC 700523 TaxID=1249483 RepID=A0A5E8HD38_9LEPT|nr:hypothetical protein LEP1GSC202_0791 [Leptospira yanagawae serovar Saopaulo str. Sao Paulo = ATCC 700523]
MNENALVTKGSRNGKWNRHPMFSLEMNHQSKPKTTDSQWIV